MLEASIAPSAPPAPIIVWISSIKRIVFLSFVTSSITFLILSSNSPLYLEPATIDVRSRPTIRLSLSVSGILPSAIA